MRRSPFYVRCYAKQTGGVWVAVCVDLCLAAQAETFEEAKRKLEAQVTDYVFEALTIDKAHARELLSRKAPLANRVEYWFIRAVQRIFGKPKERRRAFEELVNPVPA